MKSNPDRRERRQLPVYSISCPCCSESFRGRFFSAGWTGKIRYCSRCSNLKIWDHPSCLEGPMKCACGGSFTSFRLRCPVCNGLIADATRQLAGQHYVVEPARDPEHPTSDELATFVDRIQATRDLFVQLRRVLHFDKKRRRWRWLDLFEL